MATWLCTPRDLEDLALGWLIGEGFVRRDEAIVTVQVAEEGATIRIVGDLPADAHAGTDIQPLQSRDEEMATALVTGGSLRGLFERMFSEGNLRPATGGVHTGALVVAGEVHTVREDVSRHCVIDKLIGSGRKADVDPAQAVILLSGRVSGAIAAKVARAGIPAIATMSIPTTLAASIAEKAGVTIIGRARSNSPQLYVPGAWHGVG